MYAVFRKIDRTHLLYIYLDSFNYLDLNLFLLIPIFDVYCVKTKLVQYYDVMNIPYITILQMQAAFNSSQTEAIYVLMKQLFCVHHPIFSNQFKHVPKVLDQRSPQTYYY